MNDECRKRFISAFRVLAQASAIFYEQQKSQNRKSYRTCSLPIAAGKIDILLLYKRSDRQSS